MHRRAKVSLLLTARGVATGWTGVDMSSLLLPEVIPEIDANPVSFFGRRGWVGQGLELHSPSCITIITWGLGRLLNTENETNLLLPLGTKIQMFSASGGSYRSAPGPPQIPVIACAQHNYVSTPHCLTWRRPWTAYRQSYMRNRLVPK